MEGRAWVFWRTSLWLNTPLTPPGSLTQMPWTRSVVSVWGNSGLQVTNKNVNRLGEVSEDDATASNPCSAPLDDYDYGMAAHEAERVVVACADGELRTSESRRRGERILHPAVACSGRDGVGLSGA